MAPHAAGLVRECRGVTVPAATITRQLAADCGRRALQHARNGAYPQLLLVQAGNRDPVFGLQLLVLGSLGCHADTLHQGVLHFSFETAKYFLFLNGLKFCSYLHKMTLHPPMYLL